MAKIIKYFVITFILFLLPSYLLAQSPMPDTSEDYFLLAIALAAISLMIGCFLITVLLAFFLFLSIAFTIFTGMVTIATAVSIYKRSFSSFFKTMTYSTSITIGCIVAMIFGWIAYQFFDLSMNQWNFLLLSSIAGIIGGYIAGYLLVKLTPLAISHLKNIAKNIKRKKYDRQ